MIFLMTKTLIKMMAIVMAMIIIIIMMIITSYKNRKIGYKTNKSTAKTMIKKILIVKVVKTIIIISFKMRMMTNE